MSDLSLLRTSTGLHDSHTLFTYTWALLLLIGSWAGTRILTVHYETQH